MIMGCLQVLVTVFAFSFFAACQDTATDTPCQTGDTCAGIDLSITVENTSYCCQDKKTTPHTNLYPNVSCTCAVDPYAELPVEEQIQLWATLNMDKGRFCQYGNTACQRYPSDSITVGGVKLTFCCKKPPRDSSRFFFGRVGAYNSSGCLCTKTPPPTRSAPTYNVPSAGDHFNSSGEQCYFNQDCDDFPIQTCSGSLVTFCCYNSRGMVTRNINSTTTGCTCTQEFLGAECEENPRPLPQWTNTAECLTSCHGHAEEDKCVGKDMTQRCCPSNMDLKAEIVDGIFLNCSCTWPAAGNTTCTRRETSTAPRVTMAWIALLAAGMLSMYFT